MSLGSERTSALPRDHLRLMEFLQGFGSVGWHRVSHSHPFALCKPILLFVTLLCKLAEISAACITTSVRGWKFQAINDQGIGK